MNVSDSSDLNQRYSIMVKHYTMGVGWFVVDNLCIKISGIICKCDKKEDAVMICKALNAKGEGIRNMDE